MKKYQYNKDALRVLESSVIPFVVFQRLGNAIEPIVLSAGFCNLYGLKRDEAYHVMKYQLYRDVHPDDVDRVKEAVTGFMTDGNSLNIVYRIKMAERKDERVIHVQGERITADDGTPLTIVWYTSEGFSSSAGEAEAGLAHSFNVMLREETMIRNTLYDGLTGLPNMAYFFKLTDAARSHSQAKGEPKAIVFFDFCGLTAFNRKYGYAEGDKLIRALSVLLVKYFGEKNCCRLSQDNFAVYTNTGGLETKLKTLFKECLDLNDGKTLPVRAGIYVDDQAGVEIGVASDRAKMACNMHQKSLVSVYEYFSEALLEKEANKQYFLENLDRALQEKWIQVYYQPIIRTANGRVCDEEALARWIDPEKGLISPAEFIPVLEEASMLYKLDLYVVEQILEKIKLQLAEGLFVVPVSVNLSRNDFDACDMVEEIRRRVDEAGVGRDRLNIEITETVIGRDFEFMKEQVERFRQLGFPVWMDDFGSGYSSLDLLQEIQFDVIKFDLRFMKKFHESDSTRIILTELMKMAISLGVETVTEGVETQEHVEFLRDIGCTRLQGFYYCKPISLHDVLERYRTGTQIGFENPRETEYYTAIGNINLYDPSFITRDSRDSDSLQQYFNTLPMAILEIRNDDVRYVRSNRSYQDYMKRFFHVDILQEQVLLKEEISIGVSEKGYDNTFVSTVKQCCNDVNRVFFEEKMPDGSVTHTFLRRISKNPVTGSVAVAIVILSITEPDERTTYADIAKALAADYYNIYVIDLDTDDFVEYSSRVGKEEISIERHGEDFFGAVKRDAMTRIYEEDREPFLKLFTRERLIRDLDRQGLFTTTYRLIDTGKPMYVNMKVTRMGGSSRIILGVSIIDEYMNQVEEAYKKASNRAAIYTHIAHALARGCTDLYYVNMESGEFIEYHTDDESGVLNEARRGTEFFERCKREVGLYIHPDDQEIYLKTLNRKFLMETLDNSRVYELTYRRIDRKVPSYVHTKISRMEDDERFIVIAISDVDELMRKRQEEMRIQEERAIYARLHAITGNYIVVYVVDPDSGTYREFTATDNYEESLKQAKEGTDFFTTVRKVARMYNHPDDLGFFLSVFTKENVMAEIGRSGIFTLRYRFMMEGKSIYVQMKAAMAEEKEGRRLIVGLVDIDAQVRQEEELGKRLALAQIEANIDALTGIKNKHAYLTAEARLNRQIANRTQSPFAIVILDVNDLKKVNDTFGHQIGDQYLRDACKVVCDTFKRSPVFRVGGDEFAVIVQGGDYDRLEELLEIIREHNTEAVRAGGIVIACGMAKFDKDKCVASVLERADHKMYEDKSRLKEGK